MQPIRDNRALLWYKSQTIRLLNERLDNPSEAATEEMILTVLILLHFNVGGGDPIEYVMHLQGLHQMLMFRGGKDTLEATSLAKPWVDVVHGPWQEGWEHSLNSMCS